MDTNVVSELAKPIAHPAVVDWENRQPTAALSTTTITEAELLYGRAWLPPNRRRDQLSDAIGIALSSLLADRVLPFDRAAARVHAELGAERRRQGHRIVRADLRIAAIVHAQGATAIATRNARDFEGLGLSVIDF